MTHTTVLDGCAVVTMDAQRSEHHSGHVVIEGTRIAAVAAGPAPRDLPDARHIDVGGCMATPDLVNTHHHLYQWATRGLAVDSALFGWLTELYPVWGCIDAEIVHSAATAALSWLAVPAAPPPPPPITTMSPPRRGGRPCGEIDAAREVGLRFHPTRGSMDLGQSDGGLPPDNVVEDIDEILASTEAAIDAHHDPAPDVMVRIGVAPCSPFSVTEDLLTRAAALARRKGVRLHTHLAETKDEDDFCRERFGCSPVDYMDGLGWLGPDVWLAHAVHLDGQRWRRSQHRHRRRALPVLQRPAWRGDLPDRTTCSRPAFPSGSAWTARPPTRRARCWPRFVTAALFARRPGGRRRCPCARPWSWARWAGPGPRPGRRDRLAGGRQAADIALWRLDTLPHAGHRRPRGGAGARAPPPLELLLVSGRPVVEHDARDRRRAARWPGGPPPPTGELLTTSPAAKPGNCTRPGLPGSPAGLSTQVTAGWAEPAPAGRDAEGDRPVRLRQRPVDGRHDLGRHAAQPAPLRQDPLHRRSARRWPRRGLRGAHPRGRARPATCSGSSIADQPVLAEDVVRYQGEPVALVAADHPEIARQAAKKIAVDYEVLEPVTDAGQALDPGGASAPAQRGATWSAT